MAEIQLLYVENIITRKKRRLQQQLAFFMVVENIGYDKQVDVIWADEDGVWQTLPAVFHSKLGEGKEYWQAQATFHPSAEKSLPGNVQFGLRYRTQGAEYWDNKLGLNYFSQADSGVKVVHARPVQNIGFAGQLKHGQKYVPITVAVAKGLDAQKVVIHWTIDNWRHTHKTPCHFKRHYWDATARSHARNPNQYGCQIWQGSLKINNAFRLQCTISCEGREQTVWDNNYGNNYTASHKPLTVMILNLHCYQEDNQDHKFSQIAKAIDELEVDVVCFQEVAENWNNGMGDWDSNAVKIINDRLAKPYHIHTDWAHLGFDRYREGVAILSRYPLSRHDARYVSDSHDAYNIHSRKAVMAQIHIPYMGAVNVFSTHLSWWEDGFREQFYRLRDWAAAKQSKHIRATLLCGDFNVTAGSNGYHLVLETNEYTDQYVDAKTGGQPEQNYRVDDPYWQQYAGSDYRIDYIFMDKTAGLRVTSARMLFTEHDYGRVSDHCGYLMVFEPK